jgi:plasmid stabilization system protein ParE
VRRTLEWAETALADLVAQVEYIAADDPEAAVHVAASIRDTGDALGEFATGHPGRVAGTYEKSVRRLPYIIAYALSDENRAVSILRVIHAARDWQAEEWPE